MKKLLIFAGLVLMVGVAIIAEQAIGVSGAVITTNGQSDVFGAEAAASGAVTGMSGTVQPGMPPALPGTEGGVPMIPGIATLQPTPEQLIVQAYKGWVKYDLMRAPSLDELNKAWVRIINHLVQLLTTQRNLFPDLPVERVKKEAVEYMTPKYFERKKIIERFKQIEAPKNPWEQ